MHVSRRPDLQELLRTRRRHKFFCRVASAVAHKQQVENSAEFDAALEAVWVSRRLYAGLTMLEATYGKGVAHRLVDSAVRRVYRPRRVARILVLATIPVMSTTGVSVVRLLSLLLVVLIGSLITRRRQHLVYLRTLCAGSPQPGLASFPARARRHILRDSLHALPARSLTVGPDATVLVSMLEPLSRCERETALALADEFNGTIGDLLETAKTLERA